MSGTRDYQDWHRRYDDPGSSLSWRLQRVRRHMTTLSMATLARRAF